MHTALAATTDADLIEQVLEIPLEVGIDRLLRDGPSRLRARGAEREARRLEAVIELSRRLACIPLPRGDPIGGPHVLAERLRARYNDAPREEFIAVLLDGANRILREVTVSIGTRDSALVVPGDVLVEAVRESAAAVIFVHNHPSGDPLPSPEDVQVTRRLREACALLGIRFLDHVIVADRGYFSFREEGL